MELTPALGVGVSDLQQAARAEVARILAETRGDEAAIIALLLQKLHDLKLIESTEVATLTRLSEFGVAAVREKGAAQKSHFQARDIYNKMLADGHSSPVALAMASSEVGSYTVNEDPNGSGGVVYAKTNYGLKWAAAGAIIGGALGGAVGGALGGAIGGVVGDIADHCLK